MTVPPILKKGRNCWRIERATRAAVLTNADYFAALAASLTRARRLILLAGWDLDALLVLDPEGSGLQGQPLVRLLEGLLASRPELEIRILLWDRSLIYGGNRKNRALLADLRRHRRRCDFRFVDPAPAASQHDKLVAIDGVLAFGGGIDLARGRWDPADHRPVDPRRITSDGDGYGPVHDLQMAVEGPTAAAISTFLRDPSAAGARRGRPEANLSAAACPPGGSRLYRSRCRLRSPHSPWRR
jgi:phosphatidylserine/phosphatidylglycerophosphate/cardiolipin synthase-like enzyme